MLKDCFMAQPAPGHSWSAFGTASATHALGRAIAKIADLEVPEDPKTTFTVGTIVGGTTVNSIAASATTEIDTRSVCNTELNKLVDRLRPLLQQAGRRGSNQGQDRTYR